MTDRRSRDHSRELLRQERRTGRTRAGADVFEGYESNAGRPRGEGVGEERAWRGDGPSEGIGSWEVEENTPRRRGAARAPGEGIPAEAAEIRIGTGTTDSESLSSTSSSEQARRDYDEQREMQEYDISILRSIQKEIRGERAKEAAKRASDSENLRLVAEQKALSAPQASRRTSLSNLIGATSDPAPDAASTTDRDGRWAKTQKSVAGTLCEQCTPAPPRVRSPPRCPWAQGQCLSFTHGHTRRPWPTRREHVAGGILVILGVLVILVGGWGEKEFW